MGRGMRPALYVALLVLILVQVFRGRPKEELDIAQVHQSHAFTAVEQKTDPIKLRLPPLHEPQKIAFASALQDEMARAREMLREQQRENLVLKAQDIDALEAAWPELREQAQAQSIPDGWLLTYVAPNSVLSNLGFQESDVVLRDDLVERFSQENPEAVERVERILDYIAK